MPMVIMEVPEDILQLLKCSKCQGLLSQGPVFQCPDGGLCNACHLAAPSVLATRNTIYEALAGLHLFPCRHQDEGCKEKVPFTDSAVHEGECSFQEYVCPIGPPACKWSGSPNQILEHCQQRHKDKVVSNPITLTHNITKSNTHTYLLKAFNVLFLLLTKVCITSGNIYYTIRYLGNSIEAINFKYAINITRNDETVTKNGQVAPKGRLAIEEDSSLVVNINCLLQMLGGFSNTTFTVTLEKIRGMETCTKCNCLLTMNDYRDEEGWKCRYCAPAKEKCNYEQCLYKTYNIKLRKHKNYFCKYRTYCNFCSKSLHEQVLIRHARMKHLLTCSIGSSWRVEGNRTETCIFHTEAGKAICEYEQGQTYFNLFVYTSNNELSKIRCSIKVTQVATGHTRTYNPDTLYDVEADWIVKVTKEDFTVWSDIYDVTVSLNNIE